MEEQVITIAIDLGTATTRVAREKTDGQPELLAIGRSAMELPTTAALMDDGTLLFGDEADDVARHDSLPYLPGFLHMLGSGRAVLGQKPAVDIVASFLTCVHDRVKAAPSMQGCTIGKTVLTCPLGFTSEQRAELLSAAGRAGFPEIVLVSAPEAVAAAYCSCVPEKAFQRSALVLDWGAGSADIACVTRCENGDIALQRGLGNSECAGDKVDAEIRKLVMDKLLESAGIDRGQVDALPHGGVMQGVRKAKHALSAKGEADGLFSCLNDGFMYIATVLRDEYVRLLANEVTTVAGYLKELYSASAPPHSPEVLLLTGGVTLFDYVAEQLVQAVPLNRDGDFLKTRCWGKVAESVVIGAVLLGQYRTPGQGTVTPPPTDGADLCQAAKKGDANELIAVLAAGADVNSPDESGNYPLMYAVLTGHADCVRVLLNYGAQVDLTDRQGYTPLHVALRAPNPDCLSALIEAGANVNRFTPNGWTPLGYAAMRNHADSVRLLLKAPGITPDALNAYGETALHVAGKYGHEECARLLRKAARS
ncbi:MAG: ankyrin repeat domain-containing protein [Akkermansia sp.]|nr:ankyrin repeat domain-containing protein [Akkermansia sp.]